MRKAVIETIFAVFATLMALMLATSCQNTGVGGVPSTQPSSNSAIVKAVAEIAIDDAILIAGSDPKLKPYIDAAVKAKNDLETADPNAPAWLTYVKVANDAAMTLIIETRETKDANKTHRAPAHRLPVKG